MAYGKITSVDKIEEGKVFLYQTKHITVAITRLGNEFFAFEDLCTHDGEEISSGTLEGDSITCPRHFAKFSIRDGTVLRFPATEPLTVFPIRIEGNSVLVDLDI